MSAWDRLDAVVSRLDSRRPATPAPAQAGAFARLNATLQYLGEKPMVFNDAGFDEGKHPRGEGGKFTSGGGGHAAVAAAAAEHSNAAAAHRANGGGVHASAARSHEKAAKHYAAAAEHYGAGREAEGAAAHKEAESHRKEAMAKERRYGLQGSAKPSSGPSAGGGGGGGGGAAPAKAGGGSGRGKFIQAGPPRTENEAKAQQLLEAASAAHVKAEKSGDKGHHAEAAKAAHALADHYEKTGEARIGNAADNAAHYRQNAAKHEALAKTGGRSALGEQLYGGKKAGGKETPKAAPKGSPQYNPATTAKSGGGSGGGKFIKVSEPRDEVEAKEKDLQDKASASHRKAEESGLAEHHAEAAKDRHALADHLEKTGRARIGDWKKNADFYRGSAKQHEDIAKKGGGRTPLGEQLYGSKKK